MITYEQFNEFIETGRVSHDALEIIAIRLINRHYLTIQEHAIFIAKTTEINNIIRTFKDKQNGDRK